MNKRILAFLLLVGGIACAQPEPPYYKPWPAAILIEADVFRPPEPLAKLTSDQRRELEGARRLVRVTEIRNPKLARRMWAWSDGSTQDEWFTERFQIKRAGDVPVVIPFAEPLATAFDLSWIDRTTFVRSESRDGIACHVYHRQADELSLALTAWIHSETRDLVAYESPHGYFRIRAVKPAPALALPAEYSQALADYEAAAALPGLYRRPR